MKDRLEALKWKIKRKVYEVAGLEVNPRMVKNPLMDWPRNYSCVCGSGVKFKKCCLNKLAPSIAAKDALVIEEKLSKYRV